MGGGRRGSGGKQRRFSFGCSERENGPFGYGGGSVVIQPRAGGREGGREGERGGRDRRRGEREGEREGGREGEREG